jgi:hypothetical protein
MALWAPACAAPPLTTADARQLARAFAPTLVFHPAEHYLPVSPLFPLDPRLEPVDGHWPAAADLGTPEDRVRWYEALPRREQLAQAALAYRVFPIGASRLAVEYWCHYVFNDYVFHGGVFAWHAADNHQNDLERVVFILEPVPGEHGPLSSVDAARRAYAIRRIVASAHDGSVTANVLDVDPSRPVRPPVDILVEKGSHAMAPDVNGDGHVTPGIDVNAGAKFLWGIRDHGQGGMWYRAAFADDRSDGVRLCGAGAAAAGDRCHTYSLQSADALQAWLLDQQLTGAERDRIVGRSGWLFRWFGDVDVEDLLIPHDRAVGGVITSMTNRRANQEAGLSVGMTLGTNARPLGIGARWAWITPGKLVPDVLVTGDALFDGDGIVGVAASALGFYQLDVVTKALGGLTWTSAPHPGSPRWDVLLGVEFRAGRFRVRPNTTLRGGLKGTQVSLVF